MDRKEDYLIKVKHAYQRYQDKKGKSFTVLNDINLHIREGEFVTVVGPSGCGKSTLMRLILGSELPKAGTVHIDGKPVKRPDPSRGIVFQKYSLFENRTVKQNVMFGLELGEFNLVQRLSNALFPSQRLKTFEQMADQYIDRVGLSSNADKYPHQLSGGMRQRVAIAQAMILNPKILLMDEPFGALDIGTREQMQVFVLEQWEKTKQTILFITHDLEEAIFLGTRVIVLSQYFNNADPYGGAKIVKDTAIDWPHPRPTEFKKTKAFRELMAAIRHEGLNPEHLQDIENFDLSHQDAVK